MLPTPVTAPRPALPRLPVLAPAADPHRASAAETDAMAPRPSALRRLSTRLNLPKLSALSLPPMHNTKVVAAAAGTAVLGVGSLVSLAQVVSSMSPALASFAAASVAPLVAHAGVSASGVLLGVALYLGGAALVAAASACVIAFAVMQVRAVFYALGAAKRAWVDDQAGAAAAAQKLQQQRSDVGLLGLWTTVALLPLSPASATRSALSFGLLQSAQGMVATSLAASEGPGETHKACLDAPAHPRRPSSIGV